MSGGVGSRRAFEDARYFMTRAGILNKIYCYDSCLIKAGEGFDYEGGGIYHSNYFDFETDLGGFPALFISVYSDLGIKVRFNPNLPNPAEREFSLNANEEYILQRWEYELYDLKIRSIQMSGGGDTIVRIMVEGFDPGIRERQAV